MRRARPSVAKVAMSHGINANVVYRWRQLARQAHAQTLALTGAKQFVAVSVAPAPALPTGADIRIELRRGATAVIITWPVDSADQCAACLRELLR